MGHIEHGMQQVMYCVITPDTFHTCAQYIMRKTGLDEMGLAIRIAGYIVRASNLR